MARYDNILETIGKTPLIKLQKLAPPGVNVYVKAEAFNPMGSVKDRMARAVIEAAEKSGELRPGQTVIEATSGNTGIGLAMVCAQKGYPLVIVMAESFSIERRKLLRFLGARVVLTPASEKGTGMLNKAVELAETHGYYLPRQFDNPANARVHEETTAREILEDFGSEPVHAFVSGFGTGGTLLGVARGLKRANAATRIIAAEPDNAPVLGSRIPQPRDVDGLPNASHPMFRPHLMQGWSPDFVSSLTEEAMREQLIDEIVPVAGEAAMSLSRDLARREGILVGTSSGATLAAALNVAARAAPGANIVCMLPDTGERYLSTPLFEDIGEDMNAEELALSQSTPGYRFDTVSCALPPARIEPELDADAVEFVERTVTEKPVVLFALEWCEFSWSVRKLFTRLGIEFESVDLDSTAYQQNNRGAKIRTVLNDRLGTPTIPQVFIGGRHMGGCTDLFDSLQSGVMKDALADANVICEVPDDLDPYELLPKWTHPRKIA